MKDPKEIPRIKKPIPSGEIKKPLPKSNKPDNYREPIE